MICPSDLPVSKLVGGESEISLIFRSRPPGGWRALRTTLGDASSGLAGRNGPTALAFCIRFRGESGCSKLERHALAVKWSWTGWNCGGRPIIAIAARAGPIRGRRSFATIAPRSWVALVLVAVLGWRWSVDPSGKSLKPIGWALAGLILVGVVDQQPGWNGWPTSPGWPYRSFPWLL